MPSLLMCMHYVSIKTHRKMIMKNFSFHASSVHANQKLPQCVMQRRRLYQILNCNFSVLLRSVLVRPIAVQNERLKSNYIKINIKTGL